MWKNIARAASLLSAIAIGAVLVARASGCTSEATAPPAPPDAGAPVAPVAPAPVDAGVVPASSTHGPVDAGAAASSNLKRNLEPMPADFMPASKAGPPLRKREEFLPATKAAAPIFEPNDAQPTPQAAPPPPQPQQQQKGPNVPQKK